MKIFPLEHVLIVSHKKKVPENGKTVATKKRERTQENGYDIRDQRPRITQNRLQAFLLQTKSHFLLACVIEAPHSVPF